MKDQKIYFIVVGRNCEKMLMECFESLCGQSSYSWHCIYVDDASTDASLLVASEYCEKMPKHFSVVSSQKRSYKAKNFLKACNLVPGHGIVAELDADDRLIDNNAVRDLLTLHKLFDVVWSQHITTNHSDRVWDTWKSTWLPEGWNRHSTGQKEDVWTKEFFPGHMRTFKKFLLDYLNYEELQYKGEPAKVAFDMIYYTSLLELSPPDTHCFYDRTIYEYKIWNHNEDFIELDLLAQRKKQKNLEWSQTEMNRWFKRFLAYKRISYSRKINLIHSSPMSIAISLTGKDIPGYQVSWKWEIDIHELAHMRTLLKNCYYSSHQIDQLRKA